VEYGFFVFTLITSRQFREPDDSRCTRAVNASLLVLPHLPSRFVDSEAHCNYNARQHFTAGVGRSRTKGGDER
jgi:hypothetical protein